MSISRCSRCQTPRWSEEAVFCIQCGQAFSDTQGVPQTKHRLPSGAPLERHKKARILQISQRVLTTAVFMILTLSVAATTDADERFFITLTAGWMGGGFSDCVTPTAYEVNLPQSDDKSVRKEMISLAIEFNCPNASDSLPRSKNYIFDTGNPKIVDINGIEHDADLVCKNSLSLDSKVDTRYMPKSPHVYVFEGYTNIKNKEPIIWGRCFIYYMYDGSFLPLSIKFPKIPNWSIELKQKVTISSNYDFKDVKNPPILEDTIFYQCKYMYDDTNLNNSALNCY